MADTLGDVVRRFSLRTDTAYAWSILYPRYFAIPQDENSSYDLKILQLYLIISYKKLHDAVISAIIAATERLAAATECATEPGTAAVNEEIQN